MKAFVITVLSVVAWELGKYLGRIMGKIMKRKEQNENSTNENEDM